MKDIDTISKSLMFRQIHNMLEKEYGKLPEKGIIAGQAVASAIYKMLGLSSNPPFNDVDVFAVGDEYPNLYPEDDERHSDGINMGLSKVSAASSYKIVSKGSFDVGLGSIDQSSYIIRDSDIDPLNNRINYINISLANSSLSFNKKGDIINEAGLSRAQTIIKSFDINCCQAAIDLRDGTVHWTNGFKDFLYQKELKVKYFGTPMHTSIRLLKKQEDIDFATLDVGSEMLKLQTARALFSEVEERKEEGRNFTPGNIFSNIYKRRFSDRKDVLNDYFSLSARKLTWSNLEKEMFLLEPKDYDHSVVDLYRLVYSKRGKLLDGKEVSIPKLPLMYVDSLIGDFETLYDVARSDSKRAKNIKKFIVELRENNLDRLASDSEFVQFLSMNALVDKDFSFNGYTNSVYEMLFKFYRKHPVAISRMNHFPIESMVKAVKNLNWAEKNNLGFIIGMIENSGISATSDKYIDGYQKASESCIDSEFYKAIAQRYRDIRDERIDTSEIFSIEELTSEAFKTKARNCYEIKSSRMAKNQSYPIVDNEIAEILSKIDEDVSITELNGEFALYIEGESMKHCVGGYWMRVEKGLSYIFSIKVEGDNGIEKSTLEISHEPYATYTENLKIKDDMVDSSEMTYYAENMKKGDSNFSIVQHQGFANSGISDKSEKIGEAILIMMMNKKQQMVNKYEQMGILDAGCTTVSYNKAIEHLEKNEVDGFEQLFIRGFNRNELIDKEPARPKESVRLMDHLIDADMQAQAM